MAMLGKRFQRTISMSQIGPGSNFPAEKAHTQQHSEHQPADQWEILKNAEAMMMMMMANSSGGAPSTAISSEEGPFLQERQAKKNEQHPQNGHYPCGPAVSSVSAEHLISSPSPTHHFLDACYYCKRRLRPERDIFIYRGDAAFCTEECRHRQILSDETRSLGVSKKGGDTASETAVAA